MKKLLVLGLGIALVGGIGAKELPKYEKENVSVKNYRGDLVRGALVINGVPIVVNLPYLGDKNKDGKYDWESRMELIDRNKDSIYDIVKVYTEAKGEFFGKKEKVKGIIAWIDDDFDGLADRALSDYKNDKNKNVPDGKWDTEDKFIGLELKMKELAKPKFFAMDVIK